MKIIIAIGWAMAYSLCTFIWLSIIFGSIKDGDNFEDYPDASILVISFLVGAFIIYLNLKKDGKVHMPKTFGDGEVIDNGQGAVSGVE